MFLRFWDFYRTALVPFSNRLSLVKLPLQINDTRAHKDDVMLSLEWIVKVKRFHSNFNQVFVVIILPCSVFVFT
jgi:hypothetical protein